MIHNDKQLSDNFLLSEFNGVEPHHDLLLLLQRAREEVKQPIIINKNGGSARTFREHFDIYYKKYGGSWKEHIPWDSRHLPKYNTGLRAVDIYSNDVTGKELAWLFRNIADKHGINIGLGVSDNWIHIDVDREKNATWYD